MAGGAGIDGHLFFGRTRSNDIATRTGDRRVFVLGMDILLHSTLNLSVIRENDNSVFNLLGARVKCVFLSSLENALALSTLTDYDVSRV